MSTTETCLNLVENMKYTNNIDQQTRAYIQFLAVIKSSYLKSTREKPIVRELWLQNLHVAIFLKV